MVWEFAEGAASGEGESPAGAAGNIAAGPSQGIASGDKDAPAMTREEKKQALFRILELNPFIGVVSHVTLCL